MFKSYVTSVLNLYFSHSDECSQLMDYLKNVALSKANLFLQPPSFLNVDVTITQAERSHNVNKPTHVIPISICGM